MSPPSPVSARVRGLLNGSGGGQRAFAAEIGLDESKLSKSLAGSRRFSSLDLARIAAAHHVTVEWLITGAEPALAMAARTAGGSAATAIDQARRFRALRDDLTFLEYPQPWQPVALPVGHRRHVEQGTELAAAAVDRVRAEGRAETDADLPQLIESVFGADVAICALDTRFDGLAVSSDDVKLILVATSTVPARQRFTLAHELGHLLAGDDQELHLDVDVYSRAGNTEASEMRANAFAAAFLMPEDTLRAATGSGAVTERAFADLVCRHRVSPSALAFRMFNLGLVDIETRDRYRTLSGARAAALAERGGELAHQVIASTVSRAPGLLVRDSYAAYEAGRATLRPYAALIGADLDRLRADLEDEQPTLAPA